MSSVWLNPSSPTAASMAGEPASRLERTARPEPSTSAADLAADASAYWSISTTMRPGSLSMGNVREANDVAVAVTDTAAIGLEQATELVARIQQKLVLAKAVGADREGINRDLSQMKADLGALVDESGFNGDNWLKVEAYGQPKVTSLLASVSTGEDGSLAIDMVDFDTAKSTLISRENARDGMLTRAYAGTTLGGVPYNYFLIDAGARQPNEAGAREIRLDASTTGDEIDGMISSLNRVLIDMVGASAEVNATRTAVTGSGLGVDAVRGASELGVSRLIDSELNEQSVRLMADKVQEQLQSASLNIGNVSMTPWLKL